MGTGRLLKSPRLGVIFQLSDEPTKDLGQRAWRVYDVERRRGFRVTLSDREAGAAPAGTARLDRPFSEAEIERAVLLCLERALESPPEKLSGETYDVSLSSADLYAALPRQKL